jgi:hypothetical protein
MPSQVIDFTITAVRSVRSTAGARTDLPDDIDGVAENNNGRHRCRPFSSRMPFD